MEFADSCSKTNSFVGLNFTLTGFSYPEITELKVKQIRQGLVVDSFLINPNKSSFDSARSRYSAYIDRTLLLSDSYKFLLNNGDSFLLSDMKMIVWSQFSMDAEGYGCVMGDYKINGATFKGQPNVDFIKSGFKFTW